MSKYKPYSRNRFTQSVDFVGQTRRSHRFLLQRLQVGMAEQDMSVEERARIAAREELGGVGLKLTALRGCGLDEDVHES